MKYIIRCILYIIICIYIVYNDVYIILYYITLYYIILYIWYDTICASGLRERQGRGGTPGPSWARQGHAFCSAAADTDETPTTTIYISRAPGAP